MSGRDADPAPVVVELKEAERRREFAIALRGIFAEKATSKDYLDAVVRLIKDWCACEAIGIRIVNEARDIPYESWEGFKPQFIDLEHSLSLSKTNCCCSRAITRAFEPQDQMLLTPGGSYVCAESTAFLNGLPPALQARYRGNCMRFGYASLAIIPIRCRDEPLGAIHLADSRPGYFAPALIEFVESLTPVIGEAIRRFRAERELARYKDQLESLVSQRTAELEETNRALQAEIAQRKSAEEALRQTARELEHLNDLLEERVRERTRELSEMNASLQSEIGQRQRAEQAHKEVLRRLSEAEEGERGRISRELHDRLGQDFTAIKLGLEVIRKRGPFAADVNAAIVRLERLTDGLIAHVHRLAWELRPPALDDLGLELALSRYISEWSETTLVPVDFHSSGLADGRLPMDLETTLFRVTQESLTNIARHAQCRRVSVLLERRSDQVSLIVEDDGKGFDVETVSNQLGTQGKLGLLGMQERVSLAGGTWDLESTPGAGTSVFVRLPVPGASSAVAESL